jgi:AraC-like DNA-binding protein
VPQCLLPKQSPTTLLPDDGNGYERLEHGFPFAIRQVVGGLLADGTPKITSVAESIGASVRTLQRRLSEIDTTFSNIVEEAKMKTADTMIVESDLALNEIAHELGYSDQAHFTRAFRRWAGVSPGAYRRSKEQSRQTMSLSEGLENW